jgi:hypothetical protein
MKKKDSLRMTDTMNPSGRTIQDQGFLHVLNEEFVLPAEHHAMEVSMQVLLSA